LEKFRNRCSRSRGGRRTNEQKKLRRIKEIDLRKSKTENLSTDGNYGVARTLDDYYFLDFSFRGGRVIAFLVDYVGGGIRLERGLRVRGKILAHDFVKRRIFSRTVSMKILGTKGDEITLWKTLEGRVTQ